MDTDAQPSVRQRRTSQDRVFQVALAVSLIFHLVIFFAWKVVPIPRAALGAAGPNRGDFMAAGGGMQSVNLQVAASRPITPPRVPILTMDDVDPVVFDMEPEIDLAAVGGQGPGVGEGPPGIEGGTGRGDGGTGEMGFFGLIPPTPRSMIIVDGDERLKGRELQIWVWVGVDGRVVPDSTRLDPPTSHRGLNRKLMADAAEWTFNPAMREGEPAAAWFRYSVAISQ